MQRILVERELTPEGPRRSKGVSRRHRSVTVNIAESPPTWLHAHGHLEERLFDAGERLRADYERAQLSPSVTMRWDPVRIKTTGDTGLTGGEKQIAARQRFHGACQAAGKGWRTSCGASSAKGKPCLRRKRRSTGLPEAASWC